jgi:hypothetical protein
MPKPAVPLVTEATLRDLAAAGVLEAITATAKAGGFEVVVKFGNAAPVLGNAKGQPKLYASLDTIAAQLLHLGIKTFIVDATGYKPGRVRGPRPDRAEAMKRAGNQKPKKGGAAS